MASKKTPTYVASPRVVFPNGNVVYCVICTFILSSDNVQGITRFVVGSIECMYWWEVYQYSPVVKHPNPQVLFRYVSRILWIGSCEKFGILINLWMSSQKAGRWKRFYGSKRMPKALSNGTVHVVPQDLGKALGADRRAIEAWESLTPLARNEWICWVTFVKHEATRKEHVKRMIAELKEGKRRPCCWIGCIHRTDKAISPSVQGILSKRSKKGER